MITGVASFVNVLNASSSFLLTATVNTAEVTAAVTAFNPNPIDAIAANIATSFSPAANISLLSTTTLATAIAAQETIE